VDPDFGQLGRKRGKFALYCRGDSTIGTHLQTETCCDEAQMTDYEITPQEIRRDSLRQ